jgi:hypothetical protein
VSSRRIVVHSNIEIIVIEELGSGCYEVLRKSCSGDIRSRQQGREVDGLGGDAVPRNLVIRELGSGGWVEDGLYVLASTAALENLSIISLVGIP